MNMGISLTVAVLFSLKAFGSMDYDVDLSQAMVTARCGTGGAVTWDIKGIRRMLESGSNGDWLYDDDRAIMASLGNLKFMRFINIFKQTDSWVIDYPNHLYNFNWLNWRFDMAWDAGADVNLVVGQLSELYMNECQDENGDESFEWNTNAYQTILYDLLSHYLTNGTPVKQIQVDNEAMAMGWPEYTNAMPYFSEKRWDRYYQLYAMTSEVIDWLAHDFLSYAADLPKLGGPVFTACQFYKTTWDDPAAVRWIDRFVTNASLDGLRMDYLSLHFYGTQTDVKKTDNPNTCKQTLSFMIDHNLALLTNWFPSAEYSYSEWGPSWNSVTNSSQFNTSNVGAAQALSAAKTCMEHGVNFGSILVVKSRSLHDMEDPSFLDYQNSAKTPIWNMTEMLMKMGLFRCKIFYQGTFSLVNQDDDIQLIASKKISTDEVHILAWNDNAYNQTIHSTDQNITVTIKNLEKVIETAPRDLTLNIYCIDDQTSNLYYLKTTYGTTDWKINHAGENELQMVSSQTVFPDWNQNNGQLTLSWPLKSESLVLFELK